jgi:hypothetical protein
LKTCIVILFAFIGSGLLFSQYLPPSFFDVHQEIKKENARYSAVMDSVSGNTEQKDTAGVHAFLRKKAAFDRAYEKDYVSVKTKLVSRLYNSTFPDFYFDDFEGRSYSLSDFNHEKIILNFNYTYCDRCVRFIDSLILKNITHARIIVLLHDKKRDADHLYEAYGKKVLLGFISQENEDYYTLNSGTPTTFLLDETRNIRFFDDPMMKDIHLFQQIKSFK